MGALVAFISGLTAAGAVLAKLAMLADTMIPEAFEEHHLLTGQPRPSAL
jgi:ZIP family zinc transporter